MAALGGPWGPLGRSLGVPGGESEPPCGHCRAPLRTTLVAKCRRSWFGRVSGHDFGEILAPADMKMYGFSKKKTYFSGNRHFPSETRSWRVFVSVFIARKCFWEPRGAQLGVLGRSWGSRACSWDASGARWDLSRCLLGGSGPLLEGIWAPQGVPRQLGTSFWGPCGQFSWFYHSFRMREALHDSLQPRARRYMRST